MSWMTKVLGDPNAKVIKGLRTEVEKMNEASKALDGLSPEALRGKSDALRARVAEGAKLDDIVPEAFALVREAAGHTLKQRHFDVQFMGGLVLHRGGIAEMRTGEGKTLTSTVAIYLNALTGKGVHVVTVNDYLAKRDAVWMGQVFHFLGLTIGVIQHEGGYRYDDTFKIEEPKREDGTTDYRHYSTDAFRVQVDHLRPISRKEAYAADITYGTNNEFGFDYLRDNMAGRAEDMVQRDLHYAIIDEVDSILIDEARTPLIISAPAEESGDLYNRFAKIARNLVENEDFNVDEKLRAATFTEAGITKVEQALNVKNIYEEGLQMVHHAEQALRAHALFRKDRDYVVRGTEVVIVDEFTGRLMEGRRYSEGLHQAIEAKEGVPIQRESRTLATITFQNYFRLYNKLSGMTGTAATEAEEFSKIYKLEVTQIPTHRENRRTDLPDRVYKNEKGKWLAVVKEVKERYGKGQPVLIGTVSIEKNELLSELLRAAGVPHKMLNAKNHEQEAEIIAQAGRKYAVTLATNMAGRGVDIILGGNPPEDEDSAWGVFDLGGLHVIGTERHESRRIDNQLRGRAGRQGDVGSTQFFVSLEDDLMRIFGGARVQGMMNAFGIEDDMPIESKMVTRSLEKAQQRVEGHNFDTRKHVLEYDDVLNKHRTAIYSERRALLLDEERDRLPQVLEMIESEVERVVMTHTTPKENVPAEFASDAPRDWDPKEILETVATLAPLSSSEESAIREELKELSLNKDILASQRTNVTNLVMNAAKRSINELTEKINDPKGLNSLIRTAHLRATDLHWMRHLDDMTYLRRTIGLQGYAQRDPLVEYKKESFRLFNDMRSSIRRDIVFNIVKIFDQAAKARAMMSQASSAMSAAMKMLGGKGGDSHASQGG